MALERQEIDLCGLWRFVPDPFEEGEALGWQRAEHDAAAWRDVTLPAVFDRCGPGMQGYEGAAWFRRAIFVPQEWQGRYVAVHCEGINHHARVWVNGEEVGTNRDGFLPFELPLTQALLPGETNQIVIRASNTRHMGEVPGMQRGWRPFGGILREVSLVARSPIHLQRVQVQGEPRRSPEGSARFILSASLANRSDLAGEIQPSLEIVERGGRLLGTFPGASMMLEAGGKAEFRIEGELPDVSLWSPDQPVLYQARVIVYQGDEVIDTLEPRFGFRRIEVKSGVLRLNGRRMFLTGCNRHEDSPAFDMAADPETARQDLIHMKGLGANFVRLCHYPHHSETLDLCDEIGLLAMGEIPLYWWDGLQEGIENCANKLEAAKRQLACMIARDYNHPALIFWSVSNETKEERPEVVEGNGALVQWAKALDPSRLAVHVSDHWRQHPHFDHDDVICTNSYPTWDGRGWKRRPDFDVEEATVSWREGLAQLHALYPDKPILISEFGYPAIQGVHEGGVSEELQARVIEAEFEGMQAPYVCGATIWCYADHPWPEEPFINFLTRSPFGIVTRDRQEKAACAAVRKCFAKRREMGSLLMRRPNLEALPGMPDLPPGFEVRPVREEEVGSLAQLLTAAFNGEEWTSERVRRELTQDTTVQTVYVVTDGKTVIATASARLLPDAFPGSGYVHWVGAAPEMKGRQLGTIVTLATLQEFVALGCADAVLETDDHRLPAIRTYLKLGFQPVLKDEIHQERWEKIDAALNR